MRERLEKLRFISPRVESAWTGNLPEWQHPAIKSEQIAEAVQNRFKKITPLFLHNVSWHQINPDQANALAVAMGDINFPVSVLRSEISNHNNESLFHDSVPTSDSADSLPQTDQEYPRIVPYRPERYGLTASDFDNSTILDIRLNSHRDETGRFAYSAEQLARWDILNTEVPIAGGSWVPSSNFPADVPNIEGLPSKIGQLRTLSKGAAIFVTIDPFHLELDLRRILDAKPDGIIMQLECLAPDGLELAKLVKQTRKWMNQHDGQGIPLWVCPGPIDADDAAKLVALGASAVAIDCWFNEIWDEIESASKGSYASQSQFAHQAHQLASEIHWRAERTMGLLHALKHLPENEGITSLDPKWCKELDLPSLAGFS